MKNKVNIYNQAAQIIRKIGVRPSKFPGSKYLFRLLRPITGDLTVEIENLRLTGSLWHRRELWHLQEKRYERFTIQLFKKSLVPGMVVHDIGAHIGLYSLLAAQCVGSNGQVYAFEPDPRTFPYLLRNIKENGFTTTITPINKVVLNKDKVLKINLDDVTSGGTSVFPGNTSGRVVEAQSVHIDTTFHQMEIDVIKMDIEGGELSALEGMENIIRRSSNIKLFVECNPKMLHNAGDSVEELLARLSFLGFKIRLINEDTEKLEIATPSRISQLAEEANHKTTWAINLYCAKEGNNQK